MSARAVAELVVGAERAVAWSQFVDFSRWCLWMPPGFRPLAGPVRALRAGDQLTVGVGRNARLRVKLDIIRVRPGEEVCWRGGNFALLQGEHSFRFTDEAGGETRIRSEETFQGLLTLGPLAARLEREAAHAANDLMARFAQYLGSRGAGSAAAMPS